MLAGVATLYGGVAAFFIGALAIASVAWMASRSPASPQPRQALRILACSLMLVSNFPVAGGIIAAVIAIDSSYVVIVKNNTQQVLTGIRLSGGGCDVEIDTLQPSSVARRVLCPRGEGSLEFHAFNGTSTLSHTINPYVCFGMGGHKTVVVSNDESILVSD